MQHLDGAADFVVTANHRVELARTGAFGQVDTVFFKRLTLVFGVRTVHVLAAAHGQYGSFKALAAKPQRLHLLGEVGFGLAQGQHEQFAGDELVAPLHGLFLRCLQETHHVAAHLYLFLTLHFRQLFHGGVGRGKQGLHIYARSLQQSLGAILLAQHGGHYVGGFDVGVVLG